MYYLVYRYLKWLFNLLNRNVTNKPCGSRITFMIDSSCELSIIYLHSAIKGTSNLLLGLLLVALLRTFCWITLSLVERQCQESRIPERLEKLIRSARQQLDRCHNPNPCCWMFMLSIFGVVAYE